MDRGVDELEVVILSHGFGAELKALDCGEELLVHFIADDDDLGLVALKLDFAYALDFVHIVNDVDIMGSDNLSAV